MAEAAAHEFIDDRRARRILGVGYERLLQMAASGSIRARHYAGQYPVLICYRSVVEFCDRLLVTYKLPDGRRHLRRSDPRHRDEDLLPFPLRATIDEQGALTLLGLTKLSEMVALIEGGRIEAYKLTPDAPWRISRPSILAHVEGASH